MHLQIVAVAVGLLCVVAGTVGAARLGSPHHEQSGSKREWALPLAALLLGGFVALLFFSFIGSNIGWAGGLRPYSLGHDVFRGVLAGASIGGCVFVGFRVLRHSRAMAGAFLLACAIAAASRELLIAFGN